MNVSIRSSLTGADLWSGTVGIDGSPGVTATRDIYPNLEVSPSTTYYLIVRSGTYGGGPEAGDLRVKNGATPTGTLHVSTNSGSSWSSDTGFAWYLQMDEEYGYADRLIKASAANANHARLNFIGFAMETKASGEMCMVDRMEIANKTGLTADTLYYLGNTNGTISTTPGTVSRLIGRSVSTSRIRRPKNGVPVGVFEYSPGGSSIMRVGGLLHIDATNSTIYVDSVAVAFSNDSMAVPVRAGQVIGNSGYLRILDW